MIERNERTNEIRTRINAETELADLGATTKMAVCLVPPSIHPSNWSFGWIFVQQGINLYQPSQFRFHSYSNDDCDDENEDDKNKNTIQIYTTNKAR